MEPDRLPFWEWGRAPLAGLPCPEFLSSGELLLRGLAFLRLFLRPSGGFLVASATGVNGGLKKLRALPAICRESPRWMLLSDPPITEGHMSWGSARLGLRRRLLGRCFGGGFLRFARAFPDLAAHQGQSILGVEGEAPLGLFARGAERDVHAAVVGEAHGQ